MASPFVYEEPVAPQYLVDRQKELASLLERTLDARNARLEGPRRFGKTSLIRAVLDSATREGAVPIEVNFLGCVTAGDVADRIERAYSAQLDGPLRRWFDGLIRTLNPTVNLAPGGVGVTAQPTVASSGLMDRLALPARIQERSGKQCVIAFDEFQEVVRIDPSLPGVFRSALEANRNAAGYIFSGSHPGLMRDLFSDRRHAFFAQAAPIELGPLPADALEDFVSARFLEGNRDPGEALGPLLDAAEGHPQRAMLLAHHLYESVRPGQTAGIEQWVSAQQAAKREASGEIEVLWESCSTLERRVLKAIAHRTVPLTGKEAAQRFGLAKSGSTPAAVDRLFAEGHLVRDESTRSRWRILDPFLSAWLRESDHGRLG
jgi:AAA+ ATPase superfamily predicted ATPase